jgi:hypothetical protein
MDANKIIDNLLDRIKLLVRENAFLVAQLQSYEEKEKAQLQAEGVKENA